MQNLIQPGRNLSLKTVQRAFEKWRKIKERGSRIPGELWAAAVALSENHSTFQIAKCLRLDYMTLKGRINKKSLSSQDIHASNASFIEVKLNPPPEQFRNVSSCVAEVQKPDGTSLKIYSTPDNQVDLIALTNTFLEARL